MNYVDARSNNTSGIALAMQPLLAAVVLLGFSSQQHASWMLIPAAFLALYAVLIPGGMGRVLTSRRTWRMAGVATVRLAAFGLAFYAACILANGGPVLGIAGSLTLIGLLLTAAFVVASLLWRYLPRAVLAAARGCANRVSAMGGDWAVLLRACIVA